MQTSLSSKRGFTLLELIIVIAILAILSVAVVLVINPAETLKRARDSQRFSDLASMKSAIGLYLADVASPDLDTAATVCLGVGLTTAQIAYSSSTVAVVADLTSNPLEGADVTTASVFNATDHGFAVTAVNIGAVNGTGWIPVNLSGISTGSPLANFPVDPTNTVATVTDPKFTDPVYRYACQNVAASTFPQYVFELDANLESTLYATTQDKENQDGGDEESLYETGTSLRLMGASNAPNTEY